MAPLWLERQSADKNIVWSFFFFFFFKKKEDPLGGAVVGGEVVGGPETNTKYQKFEWRVSLPKSQNFSYKKKFGLQF